ncbi:MAG: HK97 gp10 family phage protein [Xanthomonadales bacterium]|nr:HK97 gp10 family phage protein [Xanthomonadales bacterium]
MRETAMRNAHKPVTLRDGGGGMTRNSTPAALYAAAGRVQRGGLMKIKITDNSAQLPTPLRALRSRCCRKSTRQMLRAAIEIADQQKLDAPKFRSEMANSIQVTAKPLEYKVTANSKHAVYVEEGTGAGGRPTLKEMLAWITLKRITPRTPGMTTTQLAELLRHNIVNFGIKPQPLQARRQEALRLTELLESAAAAGMAKVGG